MTTLETLRAARALISDEGNWCQNAETDSWGRHCAMGAIGAAEGKSMGSTECYVALAERLNGRGVREFNDSHTHAEVLELFDHAIARLEEQESGEKLCPISDTSTSSRLSLVPA